MGGFGETLPYHDNKATLDKTKKDKWGLNVLAIDCELKENELKMRKDMIADAVEMLEAAGIKNPKGRDGDGTLGRGIHEMGTARMGNDPENFCTQQMEPGVGLHECICYRWCVHDVSSLVKIRHSPIWH
jgi:choline dehydrogenase-like flavoprotein